MSVFVVLLFFGNFDSKKIKGLLGGDQSPFIIKGTAFMLLDAERSVLRQNNLSGGRLI